MIKRPLNSMFSEKVKLLAKTTTIRGKPWPIGRPIMLYNWSGKAYSSKQIDVAAIEVESATPIEITHLPSGALLYNFLIPEEQPEGELWESEGFNDGHEMDEWFRPLVKQGEPITQYLMKFKLL